MEVVDKLPIKDISLLLGNDIEGTITYPEKERLQDEARSPRKEVERRNCRSKMSAVVTGQRSHQMEKTQAADPRQKQNL